MQISFVRSRQRAVEGRKEARAERSGEAFSASCYRVSISAASCLEYKVCCWEKASEARENMGMSKLVISTCAKQTTPSAAGAPAQQVVRLQKHLIPDSNGDACTRKSLDCQDWTKNKLHATGLYSENVQADDLIAQSEYISSIAVQFQVRRGNHLHIIYHTDNACTPHMWQKRESRFQRCNGDADRYSPNPLDAPATPLAYILRRTPA
jgi:hypothetical protein